MLERCPIHSDPYATGDRHSMKNFPVVIAFVITLYPRIISLQ